MTRHKKEIAVLVVALVILGVSLFTMMRRNAPRPATEQAKAPSETAKPRQPAEAGPEEAGGPASQEGASSRDPFAALPGAPEGPSAPPEETPGTAGQEPGVKPPAPPAGAEGAPGEAAKPDITLTGIITGQPSVAVIYHGDQRRYARVGDRIGDYRVQTIGRQEVVLVGPTGKLILRMGGRQ